MKIFAAVIFAVIFSGLCLADELRIGQVSVGTTPVKIGNEVGRYKLLIRNTSSSVSVYCSTSSRVNSSTGFEIAPQDVYSAFETSPFVGTSSLGAPFYCVTASGTATVGFVEAGR